MGEKSQDYFPEKAIENETVMMSLTVFCKDCLAFGNFVCWLDCQQSLFSSKIRGEERKQVVCERDCERDMLTAMPSDACATSSLGHRR